MFLPCFLVGVKWASVFISGLLILPLCTDFSLVGSVGVLLLELNSKKYKIHISVTVNLKISLFKTEQIRNIV